MAVVKRRKLQVLKKRGNFVKEEPLPMLTVSTHLRNIYGTQIKLSFPGKFVYIMVFFDRGNWRKKII